MLREYSRFCHNQIGSRVAPLLPLLEDIKELIAKANIEIPYAQYVSMMVFTSSVFTLSIIAVIMPLMFINFGFAGFLGSLLIALVTLIIFLSIFYIVPYFIVSNRRSKMKDTLPFATIYLKTLVGTGTPLSKVFQNLSEIDQYGEVAKEAEKIHNDLETFNLSLSQALENSIERSPSEDYQKLLWGLNHTLNTGGSAEDYLSKQAEELMNDYRRRVEQFSEQLSLLIEIYITLVIVGSIIFSAMGPIITIVSPEINPGTIVLIQSLSIFVLLPFISLAFIILMEGMAPGGIR